LLRNLDRIVDKANANFGAILLERMDAFALVAAKQAAGYLRQSIPLTIGYNVPAPSVLQELVRKNPFDGELLKDWAASVGSAAKKSLRRQLNIGLTSGESIDAITRRIMGDPVASRAFTGAATMKAQRRNVRSVVRTMSNGVFNGARQATYEANSDVLKGIQWVSTLDVRTTDICQSLDGQVFSVTAGPRPPAHHQCRSTTVPITKSWKELGVNAKDPRIGGRAYRDVKTGLSGVLPDRPKYPQWLRKQDRASQVAVLGERRTRLFRGNRLAFDDLFKNNRMLTLDELALREGIDL
jgi:SPP1 gp7 family putative phage head morphogenesis protein